MQNSLVVPSQLTNYHVNEAGPIVIALAFVIMLGGIVAASIVICGWRGAKSVGFNASQRKVEIVCR